jgi:hypothetical protein
MPQEEPDRRLSPFLRPLFRFRLIIIIGGGAMCRVLTGAIRLDQRAI